MSELERRAVAMWHELDKDLKAAQKHELSDYFKAVTLARMNTIVKLLGYTPEEKARLR